MMSFAPLFTVFCVALSVLAAPSATASVSFDQVFDNANGDLHTVSCSDGPNGLLTKGFTTFGSLPNFPNIGGAAAVAGFNSPNCGACFQLTFNGTSINVLAIDHASPGFNIGLKAMNKLTNNQGEFLGRINAQFSQVNASACGL